MPACLLRLNKLFANLFGLCLNFNSAAIFSF
jgi:hypothetical protein